MASFPTLSTGTTAVYPVSEQVMFKTGKIDYLDGSAQFWRKQAMLRRFVLSFNRISRADKNTLVTFFDSVKGSFDMTWTFPIGSDSWSYCFFEEDSINILESNVNPNSFTLTIPLRQVRKN